MFMTQNIAPMAYGGNTYGMNSNYLQGAPGGGGANCKSFQNFLNNSATVISNLRPDDNGNISCTLEAQKYSTILILA